MCPEPLCWEVPLLGTRAVFTETAAESSKEIYIISGAGRDRIFGFRFKFHIMIPRWRVFCYLPTWDWFPSEASKSNTSTVAGAQETVRDGGRKFSRVHSPSYGFTVSKGNPTRGSQAGHIIRSPSVGSGVSHAGGPGLGHSEWLQGTVVYQEIGRQLNILALRSLYGWSSDFVGSPCSVPRHEAWEPSALLEAPSHSTSSLLFIYCATSTCITSIINTDGGFPLPAPPLPVV